MKANTVFSGIRILANVDSVFMSSLRGQGLTNALAHLLVMRRNNLWHVRTYTSVAARFKSFMKKIFYMFPMFLMAVGSMKKNINLFFLFSFFLDAYRRG